VLEALRPEHALARTDRRPVRADARPALALEAEDEDVEVFRMPMLVDRPVRLEAEQGKKRTGLGEQDLAVDPDAAFVRERRPLRPLERLEVQFQTRTSR
jgi:hypothetical protein